MLTKAELKDILISNLTHKYMYSIQLFLTKLISRILFNCNINQYRIKNIITDTYITNLDEFIAAIDENYLSVSYDFFNEKVNKGITRPFYVLLDNLNVELTMSSNEDIVYFNLCGDNCRREIIYGIELRKIAFVMGYFGNQDPILPLKITDVELLYE